MTQKKYKHNNLRIDYVTANLSLLLLHFGNLYKCRQELIRAFLKNVLNAKSFDKMEVVLNSDFLKCNVFFVHLYLYA